MWGESGSLTLLTFSLNYKRVWEHIDVQLLIISLEGTRTYVLSKYVDLFVGFYLLFRVIVAIFDALSVHFRWHNGKAARTFYQEIPAF